MSWNDFFRFVMFYSMAPSIAVYYFLLNIFPYSKGNSIVFQQIVDITTLLGTLDQLDLVSGKIYNNCDCSNKGFISFRQFLSFVKKSSKLWKPLYSFRLAIMERFFDKSSVYNILNRKMVLASIKKYRQLNNNKFPPEPCCQKVKHILENRPSSYQFDYECNDKDSECNFTVATLNYITKFNNHFIRDFTGSFSKYMNTISSDYESIFLHIDQCYLRFNGPMVKSPNQSSINNTGSVRMRAGTDNDLFSLNNNIALVASGRGRGNSSGNGPNILSPNPNNNNNNNMNSKTSFTAFSQNGSVREPRLSILKSPANHCKARQSSSLMLSPFTASGRHLRLAEKPSCTFGEENPLITSPLNHNGSGTITNNRRIRSSPKINNINNLVNCATRITEENDNNNNNNSSGNTSANSRNSRATTPIITSPSTTITTTTTAVNSNLSNLQNENIVGKSKTVNSVDSIKKNKVLPLEDIKAPKTT